MDSTYFGTILCNVKFKKIDIAINILVISITKIRVA